MNKVIQLTEDDLAANHGGTDSFARDVGQYIGGFFGAYVEHPILSNLPYFGPFFTNAAAIKAASQ